MLHQFHRAGSGIAATGEQRRCSEPLGRVISPASRWQDYNSGSIISTTIREGYGAMGDLEDLAAAARAKETKIPTPIDAPIVHSAGWLKRYINRSGKRSFIFQVVCLTWTALFGFAWLAMIASVAGQPPMYLNPQENSTATGATAASGSCCLLGGWILVVLPCGIAAVATYEANKLS
jgi:hypothetical protein